MEMLFEDRLFPLTSIIGFVESDCRTAAETFWERRRVGWQEWGNQVQLNPVVGDLWTLLQQLLPLKQVQPSRFLFVPTRSRWCAYFDNYHLGADVFSSLYTVATTLGCRALRIAYIPHTYRGKGQAALGRYGATSFEIIDPRNAPAPLHYLRTVHAINDGGRWTFAAEGTLQPFEEPEYYQYRTIAKRFPPELLDNYLRALGIHAFEPDFYMPPESRAWRCAVRGAIDDRSLDFTLAEVQQRCEGQVFPPLK